MFSWTNGGSASSTTTTSNTSSSNYPASRIGLGGRSNNSNNVHTSVAGSIRPPNSSGGPTITRAQHLQSYLEDSTLQRSTRRVSSGKSYSASSSKEMRRQTRKRRCHVALGTIFTYFRFVRLQFGWLSFSASWWLIDWFVFVYYSLLARLLWEPLESFLFLLPKLTHSLTSLSGTTHTIYYNYKK